MTRWRKAYQTDIAGRYNGECAAWESPLEPDVFLLPAGATFKAPPDPIPAGKWARFNGNDWELASSSTAPTIATPATTGATGGELSSEVLLEEF